MALCYYIGFRDRFGAHRATKWGESPAEALAFLRKSNAGRGETDYDKPVPLAPQPFTEESRDARALSWGTSKTG